MSLTVEEVARHLAALTHTEEDILLIAVWIDARWKEIAAANNLRVLLREGELFMNKPEQVGTVDVTQGSEVVTGTGTSWTNALEGQYLRAKSAWYEIVTIVSATELVLRTAYAEPTTTGVRE